MNCLHCGERKPIARGINKPMGTFRKGYKASIYARKVKDEEGAERISINNICSEHNQERYNDRDLTGLIKFQDLPLELTSKALDLFNQGKNMGGIIQELRACFTGYDF